MTRLIGWFGIVALALASQHFDNGPLRAACLPALLLMFAWSAPRALRGGLIALAAASAILIAAGFGERALDAAPALIAGLVGWLFARTLGRGRTPLIARAIAALDGPAPLADTAVARYARRLTQLWACYQALLAAIALLLAIGTWYWPQTFALLPGPRLFGVVVLPLAVLALALAEFALRPTLLPQAPRRTLWTFARDLARAWPSILSDA